MPIEIFDEDQFLELSKISEYCKVKKMEEVMKLKLRTPKTLYTFKVNFSRLEDIYKKIQCEIREI